VSVLRIYQSASMGVREYVRTPLLLALVLVLPAYFVGVFSYITPTSTMPIEVAGTSMSTELNTLIATLMTPLATALVGGLVGLFLIQAAQSADGRLVICGYRPFELVLSRLGILIVSGAIVTGISVGVLLLSFTPEQPQTFAAMVLAAAVTYGMFGVLAGTVLDTLPGVYVMLFLPIVDIVLFQNPVATDSPEWIKVLPGHYVTAGAMQAAFTDSVDVEVLVGSGVYLVGLVVVGSIVFFSLTRRR
jgi:ABC-2 type transport system permease protein